MANEIKTWRGAIEPAHDGTTTTPNTIGAWRGAVELTEVAAGGGLSVIIAMYHYMHNIKR